MPIVNIYMDTRSTIRMNDNTALSNSLAALATVVATLHPAAVNHIVYDPLASNDPFDLSTRSGSSAYGKISSTLDTKLNGDVSTFPSFVVSLRIRAREGKWDAPGNEGILTIVGKNILMNYHYIDDIQVEDVQSTQINIRAIQNEKATYNCVKTSIRGDIEDTIFSQFDNLPMAEYGNDLFKKITTFTTVSSL